MKPDVKKIIITNLPYLLFVWLFGKMGEAWRLAAGADASQKMLHFMDSLAAAFANGLPSRTSTAPAMPIHRSKVWRLGRPLANAAARLSMKWSIFWEASAQIGRASCRERV